MLVVLRLRGVACLSHAPTRKSFGVEVLNFFLDSNATPIR